jgi:sterol desaturase/sphingolipid hydroxylase (fatty acid hydroxylase superfamily)
MALADSAPGLAKAVIYVTAFSLFALLLLEAAIPRTADEPSASAKLHHLLRNAALWVCGVLVAQWLVLQVTGSSSWWRPIEPRGLGAVLPLWAQLLVVVVLLDLTEYLRHRVFHHVRPLWLVHTVHHSDHEVDVTTGLRFHPLETGFIALLQTSLLAVAGLPLLGLIIHALVQIPTSALQHAAVRLPPSFERVAGWLIVTPGMHRVHHSTEYIETNSNYGELFSVWDRLFGTYTAPGSARENPMGLRALMADSWQSAVGMMMTPFRARAIREF